MMPIRMIRTMINPTMITPVVSPIKLGSITGVGTGVGLEVILVGDEVDWKDNEVGCDALTGLETLKMVRNTIITMAKNTNCLMEFFMSTASIT